MDITVKEIGRNGVQEEMNRLSRIVRDNWSTLYEGARRLDAHIPSDYWAPQRIQFGLVRLHKAYGVKWVDAGGGIPRWHANHDYEGVLKEEHVLTAVKAVNDLFAAAAEEVPCSFTIKLMKESTR